MGGGKERGRRIRGRGGPKGLWASQNSHPVAAPLPCLLGTLPFLPHPLPKPPGLLKLSCLLVQFHFLTRQTRAGSACPFTPTGWLSAAVASVLVRKIKKEVKEAEAMEVPAGARIWA